jgi:hypothetical protein
MSVFVEMQYIVSLHFFIDIYEKTIPLQSIFSINTIENVK